MNDETPEPLSAPIAPPRRPTILDVAKAAGVSATTVSHALNGKGYVDEKTRERVKAAVKTLGYRPNVRAQRLRTGEAQTIALISSMPFEIAGGPSRLGFLMEVAAVAAAEALTRGLALVLVPPLMGDRLVLEKLDIDGAIVIEPTRDDRNVAHLIERGLPVVCLGRQPASNQTGQPPFDQDHGQSGLEENSEPVPYIDIHSAATTELLLNHLWEQGGRNIALLIGAQQRNSYIEAEATYRAFCAAQGIEPLIAKADESGGKAAGHSATLELLRKYPYIDALCAPVDAFAVGAVQAAGELGRRIPQDLKIVTRYDGMRAKSCEPPLTAVNLHLDTLALLSVELLFAYLGGKRDTLTLEPPAPQLIVRASSWADS